MKEILLDYFLKPLGQALLDNFKEQPLTISLIMVISALLFVSVKRYRDEMRNRLADCEESHVAQGGLLSDAMQLLAEQKGVHGGRRSIAKAQDYDRRLAEIVKRAADEREATIERREKWIKAEKKTLNLNFRLFGK